MMRNYTKSRAMAIAVLMAILAIGWYAPTSVPQQSAEPTMQIGIGLCFVPGAPVYNLQALLQAYSITPSRIISSEGSVRAYPDFRVETIRRGPGRIVIEGLDEARTPVMVEIAVMVVDCPNVPAQPLPDPARMVPLTPAPINLCVGETRGAYFEVWVNAGGLLHRDPARIEEVIVSAPGFITVEVANPGWVRVTGLAPTPPGGVALTVRGRSQPLGISPFTDLVAATVIIDVILCPPPPTVGNGCPPGTIQVGGGYVPRVLAPIPPGGPRFLPANLPPPPPASIYVGYERFEVGVTPNQRAVGVVQEPFPPPGGFNLLKGWRTTDQGERTNFYNWGPSFLDPLPPVPGPDRRWSTRWVAYRGYFKCAAPLIIFKFKDLNGNGIWDFGEPPIPSWKITVSGPVQQGQIPPIAAQGVTDANGLFSFTLSVAGTYRISEELRPGWQPTTAPFVTVAVVEQPAPKKGLIQPARVIPQIVPGVGLVELAALFGNRPGLSIGFRIGPNGSCHAPTTGLTISVQINRIEATLTDCKTDKPIPEGIPSAFVLNPKEGVHEIKTLDDVKDVTVYAEGYHPKTVPKGMIIRVGFGPFAVQVMVLGTICLDPSD